MEDTTIRACPLCGNPDLKWVGGGENAFFDWAGRTSLAGQMFCENCGKKVLPMVFNSKEDYEKSMKSLKKMDIKEEKTTLKEKLIRIFSSPINIVAFILLLFAISIDLAALIGLLAIILGFFAVLYVISFILRRLSAKKEKS